ncbi:MAG: hypothetical protein Q4C83_01960 [Candidatus Saccharibacteria bacterium]|nr:hypothetical protein [Candidatus Saccharibacteria bacterium]
MDISKVEKAKLVRDSGSVTARQLHQTNNNSKWKFKYLPAVVVAIFVALLVGANLIGYMQVAFKQPGQRMALVGNVCTDDDIQVSNQQEAADGDLSQVNDKLNELANDIVKRNGYEQDYTCLSILAQNASTQLDAEAAEQIANQLEKLEKSNSGIYRPVAMEYYITSTRLRSNIKMWTGDTGDDDGIITSDQNPDAGHVYVD